MTDRPGTDSFRTMLASIFAGLLTASSPAPAEVKAVFDHFYSGNHMVIAEAMLCRDLELQNKKSRYNCNATYQGRAKVGSRVYVHITALVPRLTSHELTVQALWNGTVRTTKDVAFKGARSVMRARRFAGFTVTKPGNWTFVIRDGRTVLLEDQLKVE